MCVQWVAYSRYPVMLVSFLPFPKLVDLWSSSELLLKGLLVPSSFPAAVWPGITVS